MSDTPASVLNQEIIGSMTLDRVDFPSADIQSYAVPPNLLLEPGEILPMWNEKWYSLMYDGQQK